jgi:predicted anti-sigma-YlaC factor YlaD
LSNLCREDQRKQDQESWQGKNTAKAIEWILQNLKTFYPSVFCVLGYKFNDHVFTIVLSIIHLESIQ